VFDLDGTVYEGRHAVDGAVNAVQHVRKRGLRVFFCTNNSTKTREAIVAKLASIGIQSALQEIYSAAYGVGRYLTENGVERVATVGTKGLRTELERAGLTVVYGMDAVQALVVGLDPEITYAGLARLAALKDTQMSIVACNRDAWFPGDGGQPLPGCGFMVAAVEALMGRKVDVVVGKPNGLLIRMLASDTSLQGEELLMVGDSCESDVASATSVGAHWLLLDSGTRKGDARVIANMGELARYV
jgi:HAD superfamily hydrolase (TIGR01450 family)